MQEPSRKRKENEDVQAEMGFCARLQNLVIPYAVFLQRLNVAF